MTQAFTRDVSVMSCCVERGNLADRSPVEEKATPKFMVHHTHKAEECESMFSELQNAGESLKGGTFFCTCTSGDHGGFFQVEATRQDEALSLFPPAMRSTAKVFPGETMQIP